MRPSGKPRADGGPRRPTAGLAGHLLGRLLNYAPGRSRSADVPRERLPHPGHAARGQSAASRAFSSTLRLPQIRAKTLVATGTEDALMRLGNPVSAIARLGGTQENGRVHRDRKSVV